LIFDILLFFTGVLMPFFIGIGFFVAVGAFYYFVLYSPVQQGDWEKLPTLSDYLVKHPECETSDNETAKCYVCESEKVIFQPLTIPADPRYKHVCLSCSQVLFKSKSLI
jgi:hypothetical protein